MGFVPCNLWIILQNCPGLLRYNKVVILKNLEWVSFIAGCFVYSYSLGEQIKFISILNLEVFIINEFGGGRWEPKDPAWRTESSFGI